MSATTLYKGAIHIHTRYSDGTGSMEEVIDAARRADLNFIIISDHNTLGALYDGWQGWHDGVLVIVGAEVSPRIGGHAIAVGVQDVDGYEFMSEGEYLREITRQGGVAFVAHPEGKHKREFKVDLERWRHWETPLFSGLEVWSFMHDWIEKLKLHKLLAFHKDPLGQITGPDPWVLAAWDRLAERRRIAGVSGLDVHAKRLFRLKRWTFFPYEFLFRTTVTYLCAPAPSGDTDADVAHLIAALVMAQAWIGYDIAGPADDFTFAARMGNDTLGIGDVAPLAGPAAFEVRTPAKARIRLLRNGDVAAEADSDALAHTTDAPGAYRVEAYRDGHPWIFSNHIYLRTVLREANDGQGVAET